MFSEKKKRPTKFRDRDLGWWCPPANVWGWFVVPTGRAFTISLLNCHGLITSQPHLLSLIRVPCIFELVLHVCSSRFEERALLIHCYHSHYILTTPHNTSPSLSTQPGGLIIHFLSSHSPDPSGITSLLAPAMAFFFLPYFPFLKGSPWEEPSLSICLMLTG